MDLRPGAGIDTLIGALESELRLLGELTAVLRRQREGVAMDDAQAVDDSVFAAHRVLRTLEEARRRRRTVIGILTGAEDTSIGDLEAALGARMTPVLAATRDRLQEMAQSVSRDIAINRLVLRRAVESGEGFVRAICGAERRTMTYDAGARSVAQSTNGGVLINQRV
jgi:hypothetical protein